MPLELCRIDDRLIHGQVVLGWGQQMRLGYIVLVDDEVAESEWERELYRMGVPPEVDVIFETVKGAATRLPEFEVDPRPGILLTGDVESMVRLVGMCTALREVNLLLDWYWPAIKGSPASADLRQSYEAAWRAALPALWSAPDSIALFDLHIDNLMLLAGRDGVAAWHSNLAPTRRVRCRIVSTTGGVPSGKRSSSSARARR